MFAYAIIAFELLILYTVFWYVFLREPQPYRIQGNPWGGYHNGEQEQEIAQWFCPCRPSQANLSLLTLRKGYKQMTIDSHLRRVES
jgi:hypothetical protein